MRLMDRVLAVYDSRQARGALAELPDRGPWVRLGEEPGHEYVFGAVGRFWGPRVESQATEAEEFARLWERGWGKIAAGMRFRSYWLLAKPGVSLILGRVIAAIRREAEAGAQRNTVA